MSVDDAVAQLRKQVKETTGLTVSCGVAPNLSESCCFAAVFSFSRAFRSAGQDLL
jgi:nucleotidyltransferase/DNA polymerase involved in DNA repair